ncbi:MAG: hypothetical protein V1859_04225 [archaeon]
MLDIEIYEDVLSNWPYKKINGKTLDPILTFDENIPYWKLHKFRFYYLLYNIPFRDKSTRYKPILDNNKEPIFIRIRTKLVYFLINLYFCFVILYLFIRTVFQNKVKIKNSSNKKKVMILTHESSISVNKNGTVHDVYMFEGFRKELVKFKEMEEFLLVTSPWLKPWKKPRPGNYHLLNDYSTLRIFLKSLKETIKFIKKIKNIKKEEWEEAFRVSDRDIYCFVKDDLNFLFSFSMVFLNIFYYYLFKQIIEEEKIDAILTISGHYERCAIAACHSKNISSVFIAHSTFATGKYFDFFPNTYYFVYNIADKKRLIKESFINPDRIKVIGPYTIDHLVNFSKTHKKNIDKSKKTILFLSQQLYILYGEKLFSEYINKVFSNFSEIDAKVVIKLHPRDKKPYLWLNALKKNNISDYEIISTLVGNKNQEILYRAIANSDVVATFYSSALIDALVLKKPVIMININGEGYYNNLQSIIKVNYNQDFTKVIHDLLYNQVFKRETLIRINKDIKNYYYKVDGKANFRGVYYLNQLLKK